MVDVETIHAADDADAVQKAGQYRADYMELWQQGRKVETFALRQDA
jgi:hypothetical protein